MTPNRQPNLPGTEPNEADMVREALRRPLAEKIENAIGLLQLYEPAALQLSPAGYWLAYSGGKDSECILELARMAGVRHRPVYNVTTIDPPELVRFIKRKHPEVDFQRPAKHLLTRLVERTNGPPTRKQRWCCEKFKEQGGNELAKIIGVRVAESPRRKKLWRGMVPHRSGTGFFVCPVCYWTNRDVWDFHAARQLPHCSLYDEGFRRLGCIGCPLAGPKAQAAGFRRWPRYAAMWERAVKTFWAIHQGAINECTGEPLYVCGFPTAEAFWQWWISGKRQGPPQTCQGEFLFSDYSSPRG